MAKQARSIATREKLIEATLDMIYEHGLDAVTAQKIIERAGASRGALLYHFATRDAVIEAAVSRSMHDVIERIRHEAARLSRNEIDIDRFVDELWNIFNHRFMFIAMEHIVESRTNRAMRDYMLPSVRRFHKELDDTWAELYRNTAMPPDEAKTILNMSLCLIRGMQIQTIYLNDDQYYARMLAKWKDFLGTLIGKD